VSPGWEWLFHGYIIEYDRLPGEFTISLGAVNPDTGQIELRWPTQPGQRFQAEFLTLLGNTGWAPAGDAITASGTTASFVVTTREGAIRFFRIVRLP